MMRAVLPTFRHNPEALFEGEEVIRISCPRCGARHVITRESLEAFEKSEAGTAS
jgi:molecular chaperone Hsp33